MSKIFDAYPRPRNPIDSDWADALILSLMEADTERAAVPARLLVGPSQVSITTGAGAPSDNTPVKGSIYLRTDGGATTTLYVKTDATTWTAK